MTVASKAATTAATSLRSVAHRIVSPATALPILSGRSSQSAGFHSSSSTLASGKGKSQINTISVDPRILDGTAGFLPKENVDRLVEWQSGLWQRLAGEVKNNPNLLPIKEKWQSTGLDMTNLLYFTARDPSLTLAFNYASALINNSYFLESINPSDEQSIPSFAEPNAQALKDKVEAYAEGIVGGGWLWLVRSGVSNTDLDILPTFGAGTLLITQRAQIGREDVPLFGTPSTPNYNPSPRLSPNSASSKPAPSPPSTTDASSSAGSSPPLNETAAQAAEKQTQQERQHRDSRSPILPVPLAVLNLHEMAWLGKKYGVWDRRRYAGDWFRSLDWSRVAQRAK